MIDVNERNIPITELLPDMVSIIEMAALRRSLILGLGSISNNTQQWNHDVKSGVACVRFLSDCIEKLQEGFDDASYAIQQEALDNGDIDLSDLEIDTEVQ